MNEVSKMRELKDLKVSNPKKSKTYYYCCVPNCRNTTITAPEKLFFTVPYEPTLRMKWVQVMKRAVPSKKSSMYCCEDHFDIENDMENYMKYKLVGGLKKIKKGVVPHKFECQNVELEKMMDKLKTMCRICLSNDTPLRDIVNTCIQDTYEALTKITLVTEDSRPIKACYICYAMLCNSYKLQVNCQRSEELLNQVLSNATPLEHLQPSIKILEISEITYTTCSGEADEDMGQYIKAEVFNNTEIKQEVEFEDIEETEADPLEEHNIKLEENHQSYEIHDITFAPSELIKNEPEITIEEEIIQHENTSKKLEANPTSKKNKSEAAQPRDVCNKDFSKKKDLINHKVVRTGEMKFQCNECKKYFGKSANLRKHVMRVHIGTKPHKCEVCQKAFFVTSELNKHKLVHTINIGNFQCDDCKKWFRRKATLRVHMRIHTGQKSFKCEFCEKAFLREADLCIHQHVHITNRDDLPYKCDVCNRGYHMKLLLNKHVQSHGARPYKCNVCKNAFNLLSSLKRHMRLHTVEKDYQCDVCKKTFRTSTNLGLHSRLHTGEKPYKCDVCTKCFHTKSSLNSHVKRHNGVKPFSCHACNKSFTIKADLRRHINTHSKDKQYECDVCKKTFSTKPSMKSHVKIVHSVRDVKQYECNVCKKRFAWKNRFVLHQRIHSNDRPYKCVICDKSFKEKITLIRHNRIHT